MISFFTGPAINKWSEPSCTEERFSSTNAATDHTWAGSYGGKCHLPTNSYILGGKGPFYSAQGGFGEVGVWGSNGPKKAMIVGGVWGISKLVHWITQGRIEWTLPLTPERRGQSRVVLPCLSWLTCLDKLHKCSSFVQLEGNWEQLFVICWLLST